MKKKMIVVLLVCFIISTGVFAGLWLSAKKDKSEIYLLAQSEAHNAYESFSEFKETREEIL